MDILISRVLGVLTCQTLHVALSKWKDWIKLKKNLGALVEKLNEAKQRASGDSGEERVIATIEDALDGVFQLSVLAKLDLAEKISEIERLMEILQQLLSNCGPSTSTLHAAMRGSAEDQFKAGKECLRGVIIIDSEGNVVQKPSNSVREAWNFFSMASDNRHRRAKFVCGLFLHRGIGREADRDEAEKIFRELLGFLKKEVYWGLSESKVLLGHCYLWGLGVKVDKHVSYRMFKQACCEGHPEAQFMVGLFDYDRLLRDGVGSLKNKTRVPHFGRILSPVRNMLDHDFCFRHAAKRGVAAAQLALSESSLESDIALQGLQNVDESDPIGKCYAGICYYRGLGVPMDKEKAAELWKQSAKGGYWRAQWGLLQQVQKPGLVLGVTEAESLDWMKEASRMGSDFRSLVLEGAATPGM